MLASKCVFETAFTGSRILCEAAMHNKKFTTFLLLHWSVIFQLKLPLKQQNSIDPSQIIWCKLLFLMCIHTANHSHVSGVVLGPALYNSYVETVLNSQGVWTVATVPPLILLLGLSEKLGQTSRGRQSKCQQRVTVRRNKQLQGFLLARVHVPHNAPHCSSDPRQAAPPVVTRSPSTHATALIPLVLKHKEVLLSQGIVCSTLGPICSDDGWCSLQQADMPTTQATSALMS